MFYKDARDDIAGAQSVGIKGILVKTGKWYYPLELDLHLYLNFKITHCFMIMFFPVINLKK